MEYGPGSITETLTFLHGLDAARISAALRASDACPIWARKALNLRISADHSTGQVCFKILLSLGFIRFRSPTSLFVSLLLYTGRYLLIDFILCCRTRDSCQPGHSYLFGVDSIAFSVGEIRENLSLCSHSTSRTS
jgi:hypothetical protein